jgi:hypothetical protein
MKLVAIMILILMLAPITVFAKDIDSYNDRVE